MKYTVKYSKYLELANSFYAHKLQVCYGKNLIAIALNKLVKYNLDGDVSVNNSEHIKLQQCVEKLKNVSARLYAFKYTDGEDVDVEIEVDDEDIQLYLNGRDQYLFSYNKFGGMEDRASLIEFIDDSEEEIRLIQDIIKSNLKSFYRQHSPDSPNAWDEKVGLTD